MARLLGPQETSEFLTKGKQGISGKTKCLDKSKGIEMGKCHAFVSTCDDNLLNTMNGN